MPDQTRPIHFTFEAGEHGPTELLVTSFRGVEAVSELYQFEIELASEDPNLDFEGIAGRSGTLVLSEEDGDRYVHGIVSRFEAIGFGRRFARYRATLVPGVWPLTLIRRSRIFEQTSVDKIIRKVLEGDGIPSDRFRITHEEAHPVREFCVQYRESDWDFLSRLMEDEGFVYYFEQTGDGAVLVIDDRRDARPAIEGDATIPFRDPGMGVATQGQIWQFTARREVRPTKVHLRDYDFLHPSRAPDEQKDANAEPAFDRSALFDYDFPAGLVESSVGAPLPGFRLEGLRSGDYTATGESNVPRLRPACRFTLDGHHRAGFNIEYQVIRVLHDGSQEQAAQEEAAQEGHTVYHNKVECIPGDAPWRAPRRTPVPRIRGAQTARVVGPAGDEIHTDEHGRIRVEFHWSGHDGMNDDSSCWIRVSQSWAGPGWGALFIPRIGHEVVVQFLEGDPDRPLVTGSVYNGANPPPYTLPGEKTKSTIKSDSTLGGGGFNELRFEDAKGSEEIFLHAEKDWNTIVLHDNTRDVGHDEKIHVGNDRLKAIDRDEKVKIKRDYDEDIGQNKSIHVGKDHSENIDNDMGITIGKSLSESVGANYTEKVEAAMTLNVGGALSITVGGASSESVGGGKSENVTGAKNESIGKARMLRVGTDLGEDVAGARSIQVGKDDSQTVNGKLSVAAEKEYSLQAKKVQIVARDEISLKAGSAEIVMKKNGDITINGKKIDVKASSDLTLKGSQIKGN